MRRRSFLGAVAGFPACRPGRQRLNVFNWSSYVARNTIPDFEREFGVDVRYGIYESNEEMLARVLSGNSGWDVVFPSNYLILPMRESNLLTPLQHAWLPNAGNLDRRFHNPAWDPSLDYSIPYMWGASGILFNRSLSPAPASWADLWEPRLNGRVTMLDDPAEVLGACLKKIGESINATDAAVLLRAKEEAVRQKRLLRAYLNAEVRDQVVAGDVLAAQLWATTAQQAMDAAPNLAFAYPSEGFAVYADTAVILRESGRVRLAHQFIDYLLRPEVAAAAVRETRTATANRAARELLPELSPVLYPSDEVMARGEWFEALPAPAQRLRDRLWTEIKAA
ncbi:MAG: spermidine/putrescine ABC transporter substrate-binding protein [Bryobacteraceae bacterium]|nr:spermidine/putrescine ABC transporter substrate-binding protein [Bryobacterales bacterium]MEB2360272.1 spermidine/putrescine ABC transporter substrate-binding protein [Bryobacterales bacterium]NUN01680.1 spermidine/putrescine ABC transporter substrate-binding protein [Bryobacteraceae bacterium]